MNERQDGYGRGVLLALAATLGWSLSGMFVRFVPGLTGWQINCWRGLFVAIALAVIFVGIHRGDALRRLTLIPLPALLFCAGCFAIGSTLYVTALTLASTAIVSSIGSMAPLFTAVLGRFFAGERPGLATYLAALVAIGGIGFIFADGLGEGNVLGIATSVLVALFFAGQTVTLRRFRDVDMVPAIAAGGLLVFAIAALLGDGLAVRPREIGILALMGLVQLAVPLVLFTRGARTVPAVTLSFVALLDVVLNPFWSWLGVGEVPELAAVIGGGIIVAAVMTSIAAGRRLARQASG